MEWEGEDREDAEKVWKMDFRDWEMPGYIVREEFKWEKLRIRGAKRGDSKKDWEKEKAAEKVPKRDREKKRDKRGKVEMEEKEKGIYV